MATTKKLIQAAAGVSAGSGSGGESGSAATISDASYDTVSMSLSANGSSPHSFAFNADGTKIYVLLTDNDRVNQFPLSTAYDISSAGSSNASFLVEDQVPVGLAFSTDGTKMYVVGFSELVRQYSLSTAFDLSTASYDNVSFSVSSQDTDPQDIIFNTAGTRMYMTGAANDSVFQYSLSTAFDLSTASYDSVSFSASSQDTSARSIAFNTDGTKMYLVGAANDSVFQYSLSTAFNVGTASYDSVSFSVSSQDTDPRDIRFNPTGTKMYIAGDSTDTIYQYSTNVSVGGSGSGGGGGVSGDFVQDFFSVTAYTGTGSTQTITNDVDLTSGGMVWSKRTAQNTNHYFTDTERGGTKYYEFMAGGEGTDGSITSFNSDGYTLQNTGNGNQSTVDFISYTFKDQDHFFKQFEYTGNGTTQQIAHGLGCVPGLLLIKRNGYHYGYWHNGFLGTDKWGYANLNITPYNSVNVFGDNTTQVDPTSTHFTVGNSGQVNGNGGTYTVYAWGHNSSGSGGFGTSGSDDVIKCGTYTGNGVSGAGPTVDLGFEPQFILIRSLSYATGWFLFDSERGLTSAASTNDPYFELKAIAQNTGSDVIQLTSSGFQIVGSDHPNWNENTGTYAYMAIRKTMPTSAASAGANVQDLFDAVEYTGNGTSASATQDITTSVDLSSATGMVMTKRTDGTASWFMTDTVRGGSKEFPVTSGTESNTGLITSFNSDGYTLTGYGNTNTNAHEYLSYTFKKQDHFFNCFQYTGNGTTQQIAHGLGSTPGLIVVKRGGYHWAYWHKEFTGTSNASYFNINSGPAARLTWFNDNTNVVDPTSTHFTVGSDGNVNGSGGIYTAYVFGDNVNGEGGFGSSGSEDIIKCGTYTGTGTTDGEEIDLGFQPQLFFFKNVTSSNLWHVFDAARGLTDVVSTNDPYLSFDGSSGEASSSNLVRLIPDGIKIVGSNHGRWNATNNKYIYVAIRADM